MLTAIGATYEEKVLKSGLPSNVVMSISKSVSQTFPCKSDATSCRLAVAPCQQCSVNAGCHSLIIGARFPGVEKSAYLNSREGSYPPSSENSPQSH